MENIVFRGVPAQATALPLQHCYALQCAATHPQATCFAASRLTHLTLSVSQWGAREGEACFDPKDGYIPPHESGLAEVNHNPITVHC